jgi:c-di-GMP-binding flagellar brake protein YcgR
MIPIRKSDIALGRPLPWPVFDADRQLLLRAGHIIESPGQLEEVARRGLYRVAGGGQRANGPEEDVAAAPLEKRSDGWQALRFEDLRLPIGTRLSVQKLDPDDDTRYNARLHGVFKDVSLIVNVPAPGGTLAMFRQGQPLLLRAFSGTSVFAFTAGVLAIRYAPAAYMHLEYPRQVEGAEVRSKKRVAVRLIATVSRPDAPGTLGGGVPAQVSDLSCGGARLVARGSLGDPGDVLQVAFRLATGVGEVTLKLKATIRRNDAEGTGDARAHGVEFTDLPPMDLLALEGYVAREIAASRDGE